MVQDVDAFCSHPWGRESFIKTIACMKPPKFVPLKCEDPIGVMVQLLKQETLRLRGFPLALQLLAYQAVPKLQSTIPIPFDSPRKTSKKKDTVRKQRRISSYFYAAAPSSTSEDKILELFSAISDQVSKLQKESKLLCKLLKRKKTTTSLKRSTFNTLLGEGLVKKGNTALAHKGCQTEATNVNVPVSSHDVCHTEPKADSSHHTLQAPMEEDHSHSPVVSQYAAQLYGSTSHSKSTTDEPVHATSIHASPIPASPIHTSPIHNSQTPSSPISHATAINAFSATATSKPSSVPNTQHFSAVQAQPTDDSDIVSLSDGSPAPQTPKHIPSMEEDHLAKQLLCCKTVPAPDLLSPLPQIEWDLFEKIIPKFSAAFHITPSKLDFSNNFLLQLAQPMN
uniref:DUF1985 domain-containing protein n=1 Tax=Brassica oleracea var. oleracea TaxID=109376 RepID=A0A0D3ABZ5_BRAOL